MKEKQLHIDAFNYYFGLLHKGHLVTDAVRTTAKHCEVRMRTVWKWHKEFGWEERALKRRAEIQKEVEKQQNKTLAKNKLKYLNLCHKVLDNSIKDGNFPLKIESTKDFDIIIKNCLLLQDSPTEVTKNDNLNVSVDATDFFDEDLIDQIIQEEEEAKLEAKKEAEEEALEELLREMESKENEES